MSDERGQQVNGIIANYLESERVGRAPDREELLERHVEFAEELPSFFADRDRFARPAEPVVAVAPTMTVLT
jgi:hypothetical protein